MNEKTIINIAAAAGKYRNELPVTYRPSVRDVCETSYSIGAKEWYVHGDKDGYNQGVQEVMIELAKMVEFGYIETPFSSILATLDKLKK
jgi:hypothetical protein